MEILEISSKEYKQYFGGPYHAFATAEFNNFNTDKCEEVFYLIFKDTKVRLGIIGGIKDNNFYSPFSAPFGGFVYLKEDINIQFLDDAARVFIQWAKNKNLNSMIITLPPSIYEESFIAKVTNSLYRSEFILKYLDLNYAYNLNKFDEQYIDNLKGNARNKLKLSFSNNLSIKRCKTDTDQKLAYQIIQRNRQAKKFPLKMSWKQIKQTTQIIDADFFLLYDNSGNAIASAIIYHTNVSIVQIIYWGDLPEFSYLRPMNFFAYKIFEYFKNRGVKYVDIGPSTENSLPNYGLCEFKESIGCDISPKITFEKYLRS